MRCTRCSEPVATQATFCPSCGADLHQVPTVVEALVPTLPILDEPPRFEPGADFAGRYTIIEKAGEGGMAVVYKARDRTLRSIVALKLIRPALARTPAFIERFLREVRVTRQITHQNVCRVHDLGEHEGDYYLSMDWIDGETLRQILRQVVRFDQARALEITSRIAAGLTAAHTRGIVHRDLKPENVMIDSRGEVFVMDFGLAAEGSAPGGRASAVVGTPLYMAPEQARGEAVDPRSDLYALGLILQEMLTGELPGGAVETAMRARPGITSRVAPLLESLLAPDRDERLASAGDLQGRLDHLRERSRLGQAAARAGLWFARQARRPIVWAASTLLLAGVVFTVWALRPAPSALGGDPEVFYQRGLHYLREEAGSLKGIDQAMSMFRRALQRDERSAPALAGLAEAWWMRFDRSMNASDRAEAQDAVKRVLEVDPELPEARVAGARGLIADGDYRGAKRELTDVLEARPDLDIAWSYLARAHRELGEYAEGLRALERAIALKPQSSHHQMSLGKFYQRFSEYDKAEQAYRRAVDLKRDSSLAWSNLGALYLHTGRIAEAAEALDQSLLEEETAEGRSNLGTAFFFMERYDDAANAYRRATELNPDAETHWGNLGDALGALGRKEEADRAYAEAVRLGRQVTTGTKSAGAHLRLALWCARLRDAACAVEEADLALRRQPDSVEVLFRSAVVKVVVGRTDEGLDLLESSVGLGLGRVEIENEPDLEPLRSHPRYVRILRRAR